MISYFPMVFSSSSLDHQFDASKPNGRRSSAQPDTSLPVNPCRTRSQGHGMRLLRIQCHSLPVTKDSFSENEGKPERVPSRLCVTRARASVRGSPSCHTLRRNHHTLSRPFCPKRQVDSARRLIPHVPRTVNHPLPLRLPLRNGLRARVSAAGLSPIVHNVHASHHPPVAALQCGFRIASLTRVPLSLAAADDRDFERNQLRELGASGNRGSHRHRARPRQ